MTGTPWGSTAPNGTVFSSDKVTAYAEIDATYDIPNKRINLTLTPASCPTPPCATWSYVGIFSCWQPGNSICNGFDPCSEVRDPNDPASTLKWDSGYSRDLVLFPVGAADPQGVLHVGTCQ